MAHVTDPRVDTYIGPCPTGSRHRHRGHDNSTDGWRELKKGRSARS